MRVFVTGHRGYIGVHLVELLKEAGHTVTGCDLGLFRGCEWEPVVRPDFEMVADVRSLTPRHLRVTTPSCTWQRSRTIRWATSTRT